jgi:hypothetical protein
MFYYNWPLLLSTLHRISLLQIYSRGNFYLNQTKIITLFICLNSHFITSLLPLQSEKDFSLKQATNISFLIHRNK